MEIEMIIIAMILLSVVINILNMDSLKKELKKEFNAEFDKLKKFIGMKESEAT